jgi:hypothetical protein
MDQLCLLKKHFEKIQEPVFSPVLFLEGFGLTSSTKFIVEQPTSCKETQAQTGV